VEECHLGLMCLRSHFEMSAQWHQCSHRNCSNYEYHLQKKHKEEHLKLLIGLINFKIT
jgi:hypothetical protein